MNTLKFDNPGVLHLYQDTLAKMQESYMQVISAITAAFGNNLIVSGCVRNGSTISDGVVIINNELMPFTGGAVLENFKIAVFTNIEKAQYNDGIQRDFYTKKTAVISMADGVPFANFIVLKSVMDIQKLAIAANAAAAAATQALIEHKREQNPHSVSKHDVGLSYIPNALSNSYNENTSLKLATAAAVYALANRNGTIIHVGSQRLGDVGADGLHTSTNESVFQIVHGLGHDNYIVSGCVVHKGPASNWIDNNDVMFVVGRKSANSFEIWVREVATVTQDLHFEYVLIKNQPERPPVIS